MNKALIKSHESLKKAKAWYILIVGAVALCSVVVSQKQKKFFKEEHFTALYSPQILVQLHEMTVEAGHHDIITINLTAIHH